MKKLLLLFVLMSVSVFASNETNNSNFDNSTLINESIFNESIVINDTFVEEEVNETIVEEALNKSIVDEKISIPNTTIVKVVDTPKIPKNKTIVKKNVTEPVKHFLNLIVSKTKAFVGEIIKLTARTNTNKTVEFYANNNSIGKEISDEKGVASIDWNTYGYKPGEYLLQAKSGNMTSKLKSVRLIDGTYTIKTGRVRTLNAKRGNVNIELIGVNSQEGYADIRIGRKVFTVRNGEKFETNMIDYELEEIDLNVRKTPKPRIKLKVKER